MGFMSSARASLSRLPLRIAQDTGRIRANQQEINVSLQPHMQNHKEPLENEKFKWCLRQMQMPSNRQFFQMHIIWHPLG